MGAVKVISPPFLIVEGRAFIFRSNSMHSRTSVCVCVCVCVRMIRLFVVYVCPRIFYLVCISPKDPAPSLASGESDSREPI